MPLGVYYIQPSLHPCGDAMGKGVIYTCIGVGLSTLLVSTNWGNAKAFTSWNGQQGSAPRLFYISASEFRQQWSRLIMLVNGIRMNILQNNPYRILGVYSNSPIKERLANHNRMKAFLKVGKSVSFPLDLSQYFPTISRTDATVTAADAKLTLPKDQMLYSQFWFVKVTPLDEVAFNHLISGNMDKAEEIWHKKECASSLQNLIVCALMRDDYETAMSRAEVLYGNTQYVAQFVSAVVGADGNFDFTNLVFSFLDTLCEEIGVEKLLPIISNVSWKDHIVDKAAKPLIESIQNSIDVVKQSKDKDSMARLKAGETLRKETRNTLLQLKKLLTPTDLQYQIIADKLGLEILQCSIDYFNDSEEQDAVRKAMSLQKYAESIVVGQMAKDRCKENIGILQEIIDNLPPSEVFAEDKAIHEELRKYSLLANKISHAVTLLNNVKLHLLAIKSKLGVSNKYYLNISTQVVENALSNVIAEVNEAQAVFKLDKNDPDAALAAILGVTRLKSVLSEAWEATKIMDEFDMEPDYKSNYNNNRSILMKLCNQLGVSTSTNTNTPIPHLQG